MLVFYLKRQSYLHTKEELISELINFSRADKEPDPICRQSKKWQLIKLDLEEAIAEF